MKHENNIDNYFSRVKQSPPLMDIEKVHQIITEVEAKTKVEAKAEVKNGHRNLLKFTIMTTIFAAILSAVLWWPGENGTQVSGIKTQDKGQENVSTIKYQESRQKEATVVKYQDTRSLGTENRLADADKASKDYETNLLAIANPIESRSGLGNEQTNTTNSNMDISAPLSQQPVQKAIDFDPDTIKPTDGSRFVLRLSMEELEKIGIRIFDNTMVYKNTVNGYCYKFGSVHHKAFVKDIKGDRKFLKDEMGRYYMDFFEGITFKRINLMDNNDPINDNSQAFVVNGSTDDYSYYYESKEDTISPTSFDFYPVYKTNKFFGDIEGNGTLSRSDFEMANDTLVPILFPKFNGSAISEGIFWFVMTDKLYEILSVTQKPLIDELVKYKNFKKVNPKKNIITYSSPFLLDESRAMKLSEKELERLGFSFFSDSTVYRGRNSKFEQKIMLSKRRTSFQNELVQNPEQNKDALVLFVANKSGSPLFDLYPQRGEITKQILLLIPVEVKVCCSDESVIFWFLPNENFFKAIAKDVSDEIKAEYNYIIAEDKSALVQPECKYFDECKNTLKVSSFKVYPNPASANATVSFTLPEAINGRITLVDLAGRERQVLKPQTSYAKGQHNISVDLSTVPEGLYLLTLYSSKGVQTQRVIVAR